MFAQDIFPTSSMDKITLRTHWIYSLILQHGIVYTSSILFVLLIITVLVNVTMFNSPKFSAIYKVTKLLSFITVSCLFIIIFIKFLFGIFVFRFHGDFISTIAVCGATCSIIRIKCRSAGCSSSNKTSFISLAGVK